MNPAHIDSSGAGRGSFKSYAIGFVFSIILTVVPFALVMSGRLSGAAVLFGIFAAAVVQILVHLHYFLHLGASSESYWNILALIFTLLIMIIFVGGTIWIMSNLNYRMM